MSPSPPETDDPHTAALSKIPSRLRWSALRENFLETVQSDLAPWLDRGQSYLHEQFAFAIGRFDQGAALLRYFEDSNPSLPPPPRDLLDIGTGSGGIAFVFANCPRYRVFAVDIGQNRVLRKLARSTGLPVGYALASGHDLPYGAEHFDVVLLIDTLEHIAHARRLGAEIIRVLRPGGLCFVTTPARARFLLARDPHYGVRYLVGLPNFLQRFVVDRIMGRRIISPDRAPVRAYDVAHLYWHARGVARLFPGPATVEVLFARPMIGGPRFSAEWWRRKLRNFLYDHVLIYKGGEPRPVPAGERPQSGL